MRRVSALVVLGVFVLSGVGNARVRAVDLTSSPFDKSAVPGPPCVGRDPKVAMPGAPHGMFAWAPGERMTNLLKKYVIGKDPTLCGASIVVPWASVETSKGHFGFGPAEQLAKPFTDAGLTVNFLFADATEGKDQVTPQWVLGEVPTTTCGAEAKLPVYWNPKFEADWTGLINHAVDYFNNKSPIRNQIGYLRFATGGGAEAIGPPGSYGGSCASAVKKLGYSYDVWKKHVLKILEVMATSGSRHQLIAALPSQPGGGSQWALTNDFAAEAASKHIGLSFESLGGVGNVAAPGATPGRCDRKVLHWCEAFMTYAGTVPLAMQPITATRNTNHGKLDITVLLQYALDNKIQVFELYPDEWLEANGAKEWQNFEPGKQQKYKAALQSASQVLGQAELR
jgi:hypothetical protein